MVCIIMFTVLFCIVLYYLIIEELKSKILFPTTEQKQKLLPYNEHIFFSHPMIIVVLSLY